MINTPTLSAEPGQPQTDRGRVRRVTTLRAQMAATSLEHDVCITCSPVAMAAGRLLSGAVPAFAAPAQFREHCERRGCDPFGWAGVDWRRRGGAEPGPRLAELQAVRGCSVGGREPFVSRDLV